MKGVYVDNVLSIEKYNNVFQKASTEQLVQVAIVNSLFVESLLLMIAVTGDINKEDVLDLVDSLGNGMSQIMGN